MTQLTIQSQHASQVRPLIKAAIEHELRVIRHGIGKTRRNLDRFEKEFDMESERFYGEFQAGRLGDRMEYIKWAGEYETLRQLEKDRAQIEGVEVC